MQNSLTSLAFLYTSGQWGAAMKPSAATAMSKVFRVTPRRIKRSNGTVLTPEMSVTVTTALHTTNPFYNGAKEIQEAYMRLYAFDYRKACCTQNDFEFVKLD